MGERSFCAVAAAIVAGFNFVQLIIMAFSFSKGNLLKGPGNLKAVESPGANVVVAVLLMLTGIISSVILKFKDDANYIWLEMAQFTVKKAIIQKMFLLITSYPKIRKNDEIQILPVLVFSLGIIFLIVISVLVFLKGFTDSDD